MHEKLKYFIFLFSKYRYTLLAFFVLTFFAFLSYNSVINTSDFWEHSAVINELQKNLINPQHPIIITDVNQHAFFSPYHILLAALANIFHINSINILLAFGVVNLLTFLIILPFAIKALYRSHLYISIAFYALLLILLLWNMKDTFIWSGFYNLKSLKDNMSYPSFFVLNLFLISIIIFRKSFINLKYAFLFLLLYLIIILAHPTSFLSILVFHGFYLLSMVGIKFDKKYIAFISIIAISLVLVAFYPYYEFYKIFNDPEAKLFEHHSIELYENVFQNLWPLLICLPLLFVNGFSKTVKDPLFHAILILSIAYTAGYVASSYGVGRVMGYTFLFLQILYAKNIALLEDKKKNYALVSSVTIVALLCLSVIGLLPRYFPQPFSKQLEANNDATRNKEIQRAALSNTKDEYSKFEPLRNLVQDYDVILTDLRSSWYIPSYSGKVVASKHPVYFQENFNLRREDVNKFFSQNTSFESRERILKDHKVQYILINHSLFSKGTELYNEINKFGKSIFQNDEITLIEYTEN